MLTARQTVENYFGAITDSRFADAAAYLSPDVTMWILGEGSWGLGGQHDRDGVIAIHKLVKERFPEGLKVILHGIYGDGPEIAVACETIGTRIDGRRYNNQYVQIFTVAGGKIVARREYLDTIHANDLLCGPL
jgi:ketosteroid isomerase-like protein